MDLVQNLLIKIIKLSMDLVHDLSSPIAALFEVIKPRKQRNCQLETNLFLESHIQLVRLACSSILSIEAVAAHIRSLM